MKKGITIGSASTALAIAAVLMFAGCAGGGGGSSGNGGGGSQGSQSPEEKIEAMKADGRLPRLDTSDSLTGIDANANGIRDDIEAYIEKTYTDEKQRKAVMQFARSFQESLLINMTDKEAARKAAKEVQKKNSIAMHCMFNAFGLAKGDDAWQKVRSMTTNTKARLKAYFAYVQAMNGTVLYSGGGDCD